MYSTKCTTNIILNIIPINPEKFSKIFIFVSNDNIKQKEDKIKCNKKWVSDYCCVKINQLNSSIKMNDALKEEISNFLEIFLSTEQEKKSYKTVTVNFWGKVVK